MEKAGQKNLQFDTKYSEQKSNTPISIEELLNSNIAYNCVGNISHINKNAGTVYVDFKGNPSAMPVQAKLGRPFTLNDLEKALDHVLDIKLEFEDSDIEKPIITDVFYSILDNKKKNTQTLKDIHLIGKRIIIEGETEVIIKSGNVSTTYSAKDGKLVSEAVDIKSKALHKNEIQGASIKLN